MLYPPPSSHFPSSPSLPPICLPLSALLCATCLSTGSGALAAVTTIVEAVKHQLQFLVHEEEREELRNVSTKQMKEIIAARKDTKTSSSALCPCCVPGVGCSCINTTTPNEIRGSGRGRTDSDSNSTGHSTPPRPQRLHSALSGRGGGGGDGLFSVAVAMGSGMLLGIVLCKILGHHHHV